jgi:outer membrane protein assembly factor BamB
VFCCTSDDKELKWPPFRTDGPIRGALDLDADGLYVASGDRSVYKLDPMTGERRWQRRLPGVLDRGPVVVGGVVYQYCPGVGVFAIDATYGDVLWQVAGARQFVSRHQGTVCLTRGDDRIVIVDNKSGAVLDGFNVPPFVKVAVNRDDAAVVLISPMGELFCARPRSDKPLTGAEMKAAHASLNMPPR